MVSIDVNSVLAAHVIILKDGLPLGRIQSADLDSKTADQLVEGEDGSLPGHSRRVSFDRAVFIASQVPVHLHDTLRSMGVEEFSGPTWLGEER